MIYCHSMFYRFRDMSCQILYFLVWFNRDIDKIGSDIDIIHIYVYCPILVSNVTVLNLVQNPICDFSCIRKGDHVITLNSTQTNLLLDTEKVC